MATRIRMRRRREEDSLCGYWVSMTAREGNGAKRRKRKLVLPFSDMDSKVGWTVTSLEVLNSIRSSALRSIPPSAMMTTCICDDLGWKMREEGGLVGCGNLVEVLW